MKPILLCLLLASCERALNGHAIIKHATTYCGNRRVPGGFELCLKVSCQ